MKGRFLGEERVLEFSPRVRVPKRLLAPLVGALLCLVFPYASMAGLFGPSLPKGREVEDPYLARLFEPDFPYEWMRMVETEEGRRYLIIKAKEKITFETKRHYEETTLLGRGVSVYRAWSPRTRELLVAEMRLYRTVSEEPYVVEFSEVRGRKLKRVLVSPCEDVIRYDGRYEVVLLGRDFGKRFERLLVYPDRDVSCPEPPFVGRYPGSRCLGCTEKGQDYMFTYITGDRWEAVYEFYRGRLLRHYKEAGVRLPENTWTSTFQEGMYRGFAEAANMKDVFDPGNQVNGLRSVVPPDGVVLDIRLTSVYPQPAVRSYTVIRIRYCADQGVIGKKKAQWDLMYPEVSD